MLVLNEVQLPDGSRTTLQIKGEQEGILNAEHLMMLPGLIDPHVHFRTPGHEYKEDWMHAAKAALKGGYTTVFDMPNTVPATVSESRLRQKKALIDRQLAAIGVPLRYGLYLGADKNHFDQIHQVKDQVVGIKVFMGSSTGDLLMDDDSSLHAVFALAHRHQMMVAVHAEDEAMIRERTASYASAKGHAIHSVIRHPEAAAKAVATAIRLAKMYDTALYILHVSCEEELFLIRQAKAQGLKVYAETTPHHLFLNTEDYEQLHGRCQMNPPLREPGQQALLFQAILDGTIDTIGSDHAPHTKEEKDQPYGCCPSGVPGIETTLPLLLNAYHEGHLSLDAIVSLTCYRPRALFAVEDNQDFVLVDMNQEKTLTENDLLTKCAWSPFVGRTLKGWPRYVCLRQKLYDLDRLGDSLNCFMRQQEERDVSASDLC